MGMIDGLLGVVFGNGRNVVRETAEVFRENAEAGAERGRQVQEQAMTQYGAEFVVPRSGGFDRFMDGVNRLPRPLLALGTLGLFVTAMFDPVWFASRMQGIALVPHPLWWLLGVIVSFYFGARHQVKAQEFQRDIAATMARVPQVLDNLERLQNLTPVSPGVADPKNDVSLQTKALSHDANPALNDWMRAKS